MQLFVFEGVQPAVSPHRITAQFDNLKICLCECEGLFEQDTAWNVSGTQSSQSFEGRIVSMIRLF